MMRQLSDDELLSKVCEKNIHFDRRSIEKSTGKIKRKYKLTRKAFEYIYLFNVLTTNREACARRLTVTIDWENDLSYRKKGGDSKRYSYCDVSKVDIIEQDELLLKTKDRRNRFGHIATLRDEKYRKIIKKCKQSRRLWHIAQRKRNLIDACLSNTTEELLKRIGLN